MDGLIDRASPRRGSLTSLHRYPSGNPSHNAKQSSPSNTLQINLPNLSALSRDLDKFTRYFIVKAVQVIVQSRLDGSRKIKTDCKPNGNDWFNLNISDIVEVSDKTKSVLDTEGLSVKANWRICCEISLRTNDGSRVVLEHWIISNKSNFNSSQRLNGDISSQRGYSSGKASTIHATSSSISNSNGASSISAIDPSSRARPSALNNSSRVRLNSIGDGDSRGLTTDRYLSGPRYENADIKLSTSCFSLPNTQTSNQHTNEVSPISESPTRSSLSANSVNPSYPSAGAKDPQHQLANSNQTTNNSTSLQSQNYANKSSGTSSSIYTIYNKMSLLLKTVLTTAHIVPVYRSASRSSDTDSCVICYRVYTLPRFNPVTRGSIEDISPGYLDSPSRRSQTSTSSMGSVDIREFVAFDELDFFCPIFKIGSVKTDMNELEVSLCYRTDSRSSANALKSPPMRDMYNRIQDEDCLIAAKQLLAGNAAARETESLNKNGSSYSLDRDKFSLLDEPLRPAFADFKSIERIHSERAMIEGADDCALIESAFERLLKNKIPVKNKAEDIVSIANEAMNSPMKNGQSVYSAKANNGLRSEPIQVPGKTNHPNNLISTPASTPKSLSDSYVFVDLNPPFASDEQNDLNSFFHGPTPSFVNGAGSMKDVDDLTTQLADIEANASQIDEFVDNVCISEDDEEYEESDNP